MAIDQIITTKGNTRDDQYNYYIDQRRIIESIIDEAGMTGAKDEHLPYPNDIKEPLPLSKLDCAQTDEEKIRTSRYPYRRVVGQLMCSMVHTMVCITTQAIDISSC
jgi:hypothetical protein